MEAQLLGEALARAGRIVAFTGAGISTESGIPDFRGPQGVWTKVDPSDFTLDKYVASAEHRARIWRMRIERAAVDYLPNAAHRALVDLERSGTLDCIVTQNIDGLHQKAGSTAVLELHGSTRSIVCLDCRRQLPAEHAYARIEAGETDPHCVYCGGILKSGTVSFGESLPEDVIEEAFFRARQCDLCLVIGSSLVVHPAASIPLEAARAGARLAIVNHEPTPLDDLADPVVRASAGEVLPAAVALAEELRAR
ncbi:MAG: Sir2 family NAD-dependent protein deacetylase [Actinomycetota bacterium]